MQPIKKYITLTIALMLGAVACERDDLCDSSQETTPRLIITFVENGNTLVRKPVPSLTLKESIDDRAVPLNINGDTVLTSVDSIAIPLNQLTNVTTFSFIQDDGTNEFIDEVSFDYVPVEEYINRACGFKTVYEDLNGTLSSGTAPWINNIVVVNNKVSNNNEIHIEIRH